MGHPDFLTTNYYERVHNRLLANLDAELIVWPASLTVRPDTGRELLNRIAAIRHALTQRAVQSGQGVLLLVPVSSSLIFSLLAVMSMGAVPVLPPAAASWQTLLRLLWAGQIKAVVTNSTLAFPLVWLARWRGIVLLAVENVAAFSGEWLPAQAVDAEQPALISHSSGSSTGQPTAIRRPHRVLIAQHQALCRSFPPWPGQRDFPLFPNVLLHNLATGSVSILPDLPAFDLTRMNPARIMQQLVGQQVQTLTGNVFYIQQLLNYLVRHPTIFPHVRAIGIGGSPVPESLAGALGQYFVNAEVYIIYGSSEAEPIAVRRVGAGARSARAGYAVGPVHPALRLRFRPVGTLTFADGRSCSTGEIEVSGPHVATTENGWLATGDFGYLDITGELVLTGRQRNETIHAGVQHYQIEHVLLESVPGIRRVAARATEQGFTIYVEGDASETDIWRAINWEFPVGVINRIIFQKNLPVDKRHHSKILYGQLDAG